MPSALAFARRLAASLLIVLLFSSIASSATAEEVPPTTPEEVWAGFDPRAEPLEIEVISREKKHGSIVTEFRFTGMTHEGSRVRVYAISGVPEGKSKLPGVLHIHGGGQTADANWIRFWNERGYAALTFNWGGVWPGREKYTDWGKLTQGNHQKVGALLMATEPSVRASSWYLWTRVSRRALTCLERLPEVDPDRLGIFGVSMGGTITWPVAATDRRVKAACAIYGVGWNTYPDEIGDPDPKADDPKTRRWRETMESEAYARLVSCPILFLNATNDQHGNMDRSFLTLNRVPTEVRWAYTPQYRHHIAAEPGADLPLWMDAYLKGGAKFPKTPAAAISLGSDGVPRLAVAPDPSHKIRRMDLFYAVENRNPKNRFWRTAAGTQDGPSWTAELPVLDPKQPLFAFANVLHESGELLSSNLATAIPAELGPAKATDRPSLVIDDFADGTNGGWVTSSPGTDPVPPIRNLLTRLEGPEGKPGISVTLPIPLYCYKVGDPKWRGPEGAKLQFQVHARSPKRLRIVMHEKEFAPGWTQYAAEIPLEPGEGWKTITLPADAFATEKGETLKTWSDVRLLELKTNGGKGEEPIYREFRWMPGE